MKLFSRRGSLKGLEIDIFKHVSYGAAPEQWVAWLQEPLKHALAGGSLGLVDALRVAAGVKESEGYKSCCHPYAQRVFLKGYESEIFRLVSSGGKLEERADWLRVPLEHAAARGSLELVDALLAAGANGGAGWRGCRGRTLLDAAALGGNADVVSALVEAGAGPDVNVVSVSSKRSALYTATFCGHEAAARRLIQAGADVNFQDPDDRCNVLHMAAEGGLEQLVKDLLFGGVDVNIQDCDWGCTALHVAAYLGHDKLLSTLLLNGADSEARAYDGFSAMIMAASQGRVSIVDALLAAGANMDAATNYGDTALISATLEGHLSVVETLMAAGADINIRSTDTEFAALHHAADKGHDGILSALLLRGADKDAVDNNGQSPLILAARKGHLSVVEALLAAGANVNIRSADNGHGALHHAARKGHDGIVRALLNREVNKDGVDISGDTPLIWAALEGHLPVVLSLLGAGADVGICSALDGRDALHVAASKGRCEVVSTLLARGADKDVADDTGVSALISATEGGHISVVEVLLAAGADVSIRRTSCGGTALHSAACEGHDGIVRSLLRKGADKDVCTNAGTTPVMMAARASHLIVIKTLLVAGASIHARDSADGSFLIHHIAGGGHDEILLAIVLNGADTDAPDNSGRSPVAWAAKNGHVLVVEQLLAAGADLNIRSGYDGSVPLHHAAAGGHDGVLGVLLFQGADKDALDNHGMSPLMWAARAGHQGEALLAAGADTNIRSTIWPRFSALDWAASKGGVRAVEALVARGANVNARDPRDGTALHVAAMNGHAGVAEALIKAGANIELKTGENRNRLLEFSVCNDKGDTALHCACRYSRVGVEAVVDLLLLWGVDSTLPNNLGQTAADLFDFGVAGWAYPYTSNLTRCSMEERERARLLLARAPANRAWRRRCWLVMLRSRARGEARGGAAGDERSGGAEKNHGPRGAVSMLLGLASEDLFRATVAFL